MKFLKPGYIVYQRFICPMGIHTGRPARFHPEILVLCQVKISGWDCFDFVPQSLNDDIATT